MTITPDEAREMSSAAPTVQDAFRQGVRRAVKSWNDFFFTPRDPTTLGLMRVCAGIFILYVHLAHTPDLYNFFGPDGWADQAIPPFSTPARAATSPSLDVIAHMNY